MESWGDTRNIWLRNALPHPCQPSSFMILRLGFMLTCRVLSWLSRARPAIPLRRRALLPVFRRSYATLCNWSRRTLHRPWRNSCMSNWYRSAALSDKPFYRFLRKVRRGFRDLSVPAPRLLTAPLLWIVLSVRSLYYFVVRIFVCEPLFKAYITRYGRNFHTGVYLHWVQGRGQLLFGDNVLIDGKCSFSFAARYTETPTLEIGDNSGVGHNSTFIVGKRITIGKHCRLASQVYMFDSPGHATEAKARMSGQPAALEDVREIVVADNVWIGTGAIIYPGVKIGEGSIVAAGAVVMSDVPPYTLVAGNPA